jgi:hypothetical protein
VSDDSVHAALRSEAPLVVVEAPAGCGKTTNGADYAREIALAGGPANRLLILTHTHAACSVFAARTRGAVGSRVEIRTIDSVIAHIASAYDAGLGLPADIPAWVRQRRDGHAELALGVAALLQRYPMIVSSLAQRHRVVICDEHQDSSGEQHAIVMALQSQGAKLRVFGDPMQKIFRERAHVSRCPPCDWDELTRQAQAFEQLDFPHRWSSGCPHLGRWTLAARSALKTGAAIDLRHGLPPSVTVVFAENQARRNLEYQVSYPDRKQIDAFERAQTSLLILTPYNNTARSFCGFFNRRIPLWEGHTRPALEMLVDALATGQGDRAALAVAVVAFLGKVGKGFSPGAFGDRFVREVSDGCSKNCWGKPATIQELARFLVTEPNHCGIAKMLRSLSDLTTTDADFAGIKIDCGKEFWEAIRLGDFETAVNGLAEVTHRRNYSRPSRQIRRSASSIKRKAWSAIASL